LAIQSTVFVVSSRCGTELSELFRLFEAIHYFPHGGRLVQVKDFPGKIEGVTTAVRGSSYH